MRSLCLTMMTGIVFASVSLFMDACRKPEECKCLKSNGKQVEQHRSLNSFNKIVLRDNVNLTILQDTINDMVLNVPENLANFVKTEVKDSVLNISNDNRCNWLRSFNIEINAFVRTNNLKNIECHGS